MREAFDGSGPSAQWLVVAVGVELEVADDLAGVGVDDGDVQVVDEDPHDVTVVFVAESDVVQASAVAQGDAPAADLVVAEPPVPVAAGGGGFRAGGIGFGGGALGQGSVRSGVVVGGGELVELGLQVGEGRCGRLGAQPLLQGLLEAFDAPMFVKRPPAGRSGLVGAGSRRPLGRGSA